MEKETLMQLIIENRWIEALELLNNEIELLKKSKTSQGYSDLIVIDEGEE